MCVLLCGVYVGLHERLLVGLTHNVSMPSCLVFSYTSLDSSERSIKVDDGVVRTISFTESDSCIG